MSYHSSIILDQVSFILPNKTCFYNVSAAITHGQHIAFIGDNGSGKSSLMAMLAQKKLPSTGHIHISDHVRLGFLPQHLDAYGDESLETFVRKPLDNIFKMLEALCDEAQFENYDALLEELERLDGFCAESRLDALISQFGLHDKRKQALATLSGGEKMKVALVQLLSSRPNVILLDEPTNHLDRDNRELLLNFIATWKGTLIVITHDEELLEHSFDQVWNFDRGNIEIFEGTYTQYAQELTQRESRRLQQLKDLKKEKLKLNEDKKTEQKRTAQSVRIGQKESCKIKRGLQKMRGEATHGRAQKRFGEEKADLDAKMRELYVPDKIRPKFALSQESQTRDLVVIRGGEVCLDNRILLRNINFDVRKGERVCLTGANGSGKSSMVKAIVTNPSFRRIASHEIAYVDQDYSLLPQNLTALEIIRESRPEWSVRECRDYLSHYLFRKNEEVEAMIATLSGGERARLCLALIGAMTPKLLILDEITNNLDRVTRADVIELLKNFEGGMIVISHDIGFLKAIGITREVQL